MLKITEPILVADRFPALLETLLDLLTTLTEAEWQFPVHGGEWTVKDLAQYLWAMSSISSPASVISIKKALRR